MGKKVAVPTKGYGCLEDFVSEVFGKAKTFTIVEVENGQIRNVRVIDNPAATFKHGSGPVAVKTLADLEVDFVLAAKLGPGASELLKHHNIRRVSIKPNIKVADAIKEVLAESLK